MKIGIFAYNFEHWKTQQGIINLCMAGYKPSIIFAADPVELSFYKSKIKIDLDSDNRRISFYGIQAR